MGTTRRRFAVHSGRMTVAPCLYSIDWRLSCMLFSAHLSIQVLHVSTIIVRVYGRYGKYGCGACTSMCMLSKPIVSNGLPRSTVLTSSGCSVS